MNINSKTFAQPRLTKRQRKAARGDNYMVKQCKDLGRKIGDYIGAVPQFKNITPVGQPVQFVKVRAGIPFVRHTEKGA